MTRGSLAVLASLCALVGSAEAVAGNGTGEIRMETGIEAEELLGKTFEEVSAQLGPPAEDGRFELGPAVPEFRVELKNFFDETRRRNDPPELREATWALSSERNLTLWFTPEGSDWRVLHHLSWHPGDQF